MQSPQRPIIILGGGGHARVLLDTLRLCHATILGFTDPHPPDHPSHNVPWLGEDEAVLKWTPDAVLLVNGLGGTRAHAARQRVFDGMKEQGYTFTPVIHPTAIIAGDVIAKEGVQVMAGAIVQTGSSIGANAIINTRAVVDHDCDVGAHVHIAPGATLSGGVIVEDGAHVGVGATIIQGVRLGAGCTVGAGAVVLRDVPPGVTVVGVPARELTR